MDYDNAIPLWEKAVLSAKEAAAFSNLNVSIIRAHGNLALLGQSDFPSFFVGKHLKVHRELLIEWLADMARNHKKFEIKLVRDVLKEATAPVKRGRPRKLRAT